MYQRTASKLLMELIVQPDRIIQLTSNRNQHYIWNLTPANTQQIGEKSVPCLKTRDSYPSRL